MCLLAAMDDELYGYGYHLADVGDIDDWRIQ